MTGMLLNKKAIVTGGSRGIGAAVAQRFAAEGADVIITFAGREEPAIATVAAIAGLGVRGKAIQADAADAKATRAAMGEAAAFLGGVDIVLHSAGIALMAPLADTDEDSFGRQFGINVGGVFNGTSAVLPHMRDGGRVIVVGSVNAHKMPFAGGSVYSATKAAVAAMARGWARDLGPRGILVNVIQPGPIHTEMNPDDDRPEANAMRAMTAVGRYGRVEEIAALAAFLASDQASYITGSTIDIDGGFSI